MNLLKSIFLFDVFPFLCRFLGVLFFLMGLYSIGFPLKENIGTTSITLLSFSMFLLLIPIAKKISLGKLITFEKDIEKIGKEVSDFKTETREILNTYNSLISSISNTVSQSVTLNVTPYEAQQAKEEAEETLNTDSGSNINDDVDTYISDAGNDINFALAKMRMQIEKSLRTALGKRLSTRDPTTMRSGYLSARQLFKELTQQQPKYQGMNNSFDYIMKVCNAGIHGQIIEYKFAHEALWLGLLMLKDLEQE